MDAKKPAFGGFRKALFMATAPFVACGMEKAGNWGGNRGKGLPGYFMREDNDA